jgi:predicted kinase
MRTIYFLSGIPASGKSTWAENQIKLQPGKFKRVNKDLLREMLDAGEFSKENEKFVVNMEDKIIRDALLRGYDVIVDNTNLNKDHYKRVCNIAREVGNVEVTHRHFMCSLEEALQRNKGRFRAVPDEVITKMFHQEQRFNVNPRMKPERKTCVKRPELRQKDVLIVDIDGTVAMNNGHRGFHEYHKVHLDDPNLDVIELLNCVSTEVEFIFISGRPDSCRKDTEDWLNSVAGIDFLELHMRKTGDPRKDFIIKEEIFRDKIEGKYNVLAVIDDRTQVVTMWRSLGLTCLQVANGDF